jgi:peptide deformylase
MALRPIRLLGDPVLRQEAEPVEAVDDEVRRLVTDMLDTMYDAEGVGLAAPQVGVPLRVIVLDVHEPDVPPMALINPRILEFGEEPDRAEEGCLSIPGLRDVVERPARVVVEGLDAEGATVRLEADGLLARVLQHEVDHLDGVLFLDRVSPLKRRLLLQRWKKLQAES